METSPEPQREVPQEREQPDHSDDPRDQDTGGQGYPETAQEEATDDA